MRTSRPSSCPFSFEWLEDRSVPAVASIGVSLGTLFIKCDDTADVVFVNQQNGTVTVQDQQGPQTGWRTWSYSRATITKIEFHGKGGNDQFTSNSDANTLACGDGGNDFIQTGAGADTLYGSTGNDTLRGGAGSDFIDGEYNDDKLFGQDGNDTIQGGYGADFVDGGSGTNSVDGGKDSDFLANVWAPNGATISDIQQRGANTCVLLSSLGAAAFRGIDLASRITYLGEGEYSVRLFIANLWQNVQVHFDGTINPSVDPNVAEEGDSWVILYQRAYLQAVPEYADERAALSAATGIVSSQITTVRTPFADSAFDQIATAAAQHKAVIAGTLEFQSQMTDPRLSASHMYTVIGTAIVNGTKYVTLRDPLGYSDHNSVNGVLNVTWNDFKRSFDDFHYV